MESDQKFLSLGFRCGLEIHQQLLTQRKLFCRCPAGYRNDKPDGEIIRHMRPTLSELGEYDGTALMEFKTKKNVIYQLYRENCCTYEMDDTPPFPINQEALEIAITLSLLLNCAIVDELHVSRKQYLDGSIPTGFQRTAIIGVGGWIPYKERKINITHVCLEEDACREISDVGHQIVFRTDRLSMPLLEVITAADMRTPREAMEVDALIGRMLKASGLVRRGIGSVRQDVNVSIEGGTRVEIKGVPQTWMIEKLTAAEALRQEALLKIKENLRVRGITKKTIHGEKFDLTEVLGDCSSSHIRQAIKKGFSCGAIKIDGFAGILNMPLQPSKTFADELCGRVKVIACLDQLPNIAVSDVPEMAGLSSQDWDQIKKICECKHTDAVVITWGSHDDINTALSEIKIRAIEATEGVPNETRQAFKDGTTGFERILPGPDRMYPDTDSPPVTITAERMEKLKSNMPSPAYQIENEWIEKGVPEEVAHKAVVSPFKEIFDLVVTEFELSGRLIWTFLSRLKCCEHQITSISKDDIIRVLEAYHLKRISKDSVFKIMDAISREGGVSANDLIEKHKLLDIKSKPVQGLIGEFVKETIDGSFDCPADRINYVCGRIKDRFNGRLDGFVLQKEVSEQVSK